MERSQGIIGAELPSPLPPLPLPSIQANPLQGLALTMDTSEVTPYTLPHAPYTLPHSSYPLLPTPRTPHPTPTPPHPH